MSRKEFEQAMYRKLARSIIASSILDSMDVYLRFEQAMYRKLARSIIASSILDSMDVYLRFVPFYKCMT
jgi:hypothetical protein